MKNERPIYTHIIFSNYFDFLDDEGITTKDIVDFTLALRAFCNGDFEYKIKNRVVRGYMLKIRVEMEARHKAYCRKLEILRKNGQKGGLANGKRLKALTLPKGKGTRAQNVTIPNSNGENEIFGQPLTLPKGKGTRAQSINIFEAKDIKGEGANFSPENLEAGGGFPFREGNTENPKNAASDFATLSGSANYKANAKQMLQNASKTPQKMGENGVFLGLATLSGSANYKANAKQMLHNLIINKILKLSPHPPEAGGLAGAGVEFLEKFEAFGAALFLEMPEGLDEAQSDLLRWHCSASDGPEILSAANEAAKASGGDSRALSAAVSSLCQRVQSAPSHSPMPRQMWRLFAKILSLAEKPEGQRLGGLPAILQAFAVEVSLASGVDGDALWPILQEKADFAAQNKVGNLGAFLRARKTFGNG